MGSKNKVILDLIDSTLEGLAELDHQKFFLMDREFDNQAVIEHICSYKSRKTDKLSKLEKSDNLDISNSLNTASCDSANLNTNSLNTNKSSLNTSNVNNSNKNINILKTVKLNNLNKNSNTIKNTISNNSSKIVTVQTQQKLQTTPNS